MQLSPTVRSLAVLCTLAVAAGCDGRKPAASAPPTTSAARDPLHGSWRMVSEKAKAAGIVIVWTIDDTHIVVRDGNGEQISRNEYRTDPGQSPKHIDRTTRDAVVEVHRGVYEVDGDRLRMSLSVDGSPRPTRLDQPEPLVFERIDRDRTP